MRGESVCLFRFSLLQPICIIGLRSTSCSGSFESPQKAELARSKLENENITGTFADGHRGRVDDEVRTDTTGTEEGRRAEATRSSLLLHTIINSSHLFCFGLFEGHNNFGIYNQKRRCSFANNAR